jgi:hypothetical protein
MSPDDARRTDSPWSADPQGTWTQAAPPPSWGPPPAYGPASYGPPAYGPPAYGPPAYGPPAYGPPGYGPGWRRPLNPLAPIALVLCFFGVLAPVGLGLGLMARRQIRETGQEGEGLALAAVVLGGIVSTLLLIGVVLWIVALTAIANGSLG